MSGLDDDVDRQFARRALEIERSQGGKLIGVEFTRSEYEDLLHALDLAQEDTLACSRAALDEDDVAVYERRNARLHELSEKLLAARRGGP